MADPLIDGPPADHAAPASPPAHYPSGTVRALLATALVTPQTRATLAARLAPPDNSAPRFFTAAEMLTLRAACDRLIPQADRARPVDLALALDQRLAAGQSDGWRYAAVPEDSVAYRQGLRGLDESAQACYGRAFHDLDVAAQDAVLAQVQAGTPPGPTWQTLPAARFFEDWLAELAEYYYSDPLSQEEIGYVGMADAAGWHAIGLDQLDPHEPLPLEPDHG